LRRHFSSELFFPLSLVDVRQFFRGLVLLMEILRRQTFGWDHGQNLITSIYCENPAPTPPLDAVRV
jgi:hypothetical protein